MLSNEASAGVPPAAPTRRWIYANTDFERRDAFRVQLHSLSPQKVGTLALGLKKKIIVDSTIKFSPRHAGWTASLPTIQLSWGRFHQDTKSR